MSIRKTLEQQIHAAMIAAGLPEQFGPAISISKKAQFGDYQANGAMAAAKAVGKNPRELAAAIIEHCQLDGIADKLELAGPGFINIHLNDGWLASQLAEQHQHPKVGIELEQAQTIVIDYSSPNLAKEMHVGHLRSTIIGDALARILGFMGHHVIRQNHVGDWGTQFGMLLANLETQLENSDQLALNDLESLYREAKKRYDDDSDFAEKARDYVVKLQAGDTKLLALWEKFRALSLDHSQALYNKLNVILTPEDIRGESAYNDELPVIVKDLLDQGVAKLDNGAAAIFLEEIPVDDKPSVVIIQKQEGGYLYATTDLAALKYRSQMLKPERILYFIDARQSLHMKQVFCIARKAKLVNEATSLEHHAFGTMMGKDGKPFKTRDGDTVKLIDLLNEAVERAEKNVRNNTKANLSNDQCLDIANKVGIGAIKYADLAKTRTHDYVFDWEDMLSLTGNTGPYLQYGYARIQSILRKAKVQSPVIGSVVFEDPIEKQLALKLLQFGDTVELVAREAYPHVLCNYLYELSSLLMKFYEACPVLKDGVENTTKNSRLTLLDHVANVLKTGLNLLGIEVMDEM